MWDAIKFPISSGIAGHLFFSVFAELGGEERQLLASKELYGPELRDGVGEPVEIVLNGHENYPDMILKTKVVAVDLFRQALGAERPNDETEAEGRLQDVAINTGNETNDFERHETADSLLQYPRSQTPLDDLGIPLSHGVGVPGDDGNIDRRIEQEQEVVISTPDDDPDKPKQLSNLGNSLHTRFQRLGNLDDANNAIVQHQKAVNLTRDGHPDKPALLNNLGNSMLTRFERLGNLDDIHNAIVRHQAAVNLTQDDHPDKHHLESR
ncbi:hypothetical protein FS842_007608 [Serendipita sp. 407]|nr:hypothetical protein FS842_007608 [Serendipita sp. 407]